MPYSIAGTYTLPPGYSATPLTTIQSAAQHNVPLEDIQTALNLAFLRDGRSPMTGDLTLFQNATSALHAVPKQQLDARINIQSAFQSVATGSNVRADPAVGTGLQSGAGVTAGGWDVLAAADDDTTYSTIFGFNAARYLVHGYCTEFYGIRSGQNLVSPEYVSAYGTDTFYSATTALNATAFGAKGFLWTDSITSTYAFGAAAGYGIKLAENSIIIGGNSADGGQPASKAASDALNYQVRDTVTFGNYSYRYPTSVARYNTVGGHNALSLTQLSCQYMTVYGRGTGPNITSALLGVLIGDSAGGAAAAASGVVAVGANSGPSGDFSNSISLGTGAQADATDTAQIGNSALVALKTYANILPNNDGTQNIGSAAKQWDTVFTQKLKFPSSPEASADPNTLNRFIKDGTFTPVVTPSSGAITAYTASCTYTVVGDRCIGDMQITVSNNGTGGGAQLFATLPFTAASSSSVSGRNANSLIGIGGDIGSGSSNVGITTDAGAYPVATGQTLRLQFNYKIA